MNAKEMVQNGATEAQAVSTARNFLGMTNEMLSGFESAIARALPKTATDLNAQRIIQIATTLIQSNNDLKSCTVKSVLGCVMQAAILGFNPLPQMNECFLIPRREKKGSNTMVCTFQIGYKGWINLYYGCKAVKSVRARVVCTADEFEYSYGLDETLVHIPNAVPNDDGSNVTHVYAIVELVTGGRTFVVLSKQQIDALKIQGAGGNIDRISPAWRSHYPSMAMAKALKAIKRFIPLNGSIAAATATDEQSLDPDGFNEDGVYEAPLLMDDEETGDSTAAALLTGSGELALDDAKKQPPHAATE